MELMRAADILIEKIEKDYKNDIALVVMMGSNIYNDTHSRSDLDMYFVINTPRGSELGMTFIIDGIGFDFWPISWTRLEKIANHEERITSIITEGRIIYYSSEEDLKKFQDLREKALDVSDGKKFIEKSRKVFDQVYKKYFMMETKEKLFEVRRLGLGIIYLLAWSLALLNRTTIKRGRGKLKTEILNMVLSPDNFENEYDLIFDSNNIYEVKKSIHNLIINTENLISREETKIRETFNFKDQLNGFYEELINNYNKIYHACEAGDHVTVLFAASEIEQEIEDAFSGTGVSIDDLTKLVDKFNKDDLYNFIKTAELHQKSFEDLLKNKGVEIRIFKDFEELEEYFAKR